MAECTSPMLIKDTKINEQTFSYKTDCAIRSFQQDKISEKVSYNFNRTVKILVIGGKNSGKTTFKNQLKTIYGEGFDLL